MNQGALCRPIQVASDISIQNPVHMRSANPNCQGIQGIVLTAAGPEPVRESEEVFLVDRIEYRDHRALDDLVFQRGDGGFIKHSSQLSIAMTVLEVSRVADSIL
jgi:hypothetical protein